MALPKVKIVRGNSLGALEEQIQRMVRNGWVCLGGLAFCPHENVMTQLMYKPGT